VREFESPGGDLPPRHGNLTDDVVRNAASHPDAVVFGVQEDGAWRDVTAGDFLEQVRTVAAGLAAAGVRPGDRVGLLSRTRYEWTVLDYAIWFAGAVGVPVYATASGEQLAWVLGDSGAVAVLVETERHRAQVEAVRATLPDLRDVWCIDDDALDELRALGRDGDAGDRWAEEVDGRRTSAGPDSLATLVYTSGTTGRPRGCMLTHGGLSAQIDVCLAELEELFTGDDAATLLVLPLAHVLARVIQIGCVRARVRMGYSADLLGLLDDLGTFRPTFLLAVPRVFEKIFTRISQEAAADGRGRTFDRAAGTAMAWSRAHEQGRPSRLLGLRHAVAERRVHTQLREAWGGRCVYAVSGGAPLGERLGHFYRGVGLTVLEGWGLTETTAAACVNRPDALKIGTVGRPLAGTAVRVAEDGELHVRGPQVFAGYWHDAEATAQVLGDDGWLRTGDVGEIDDEGFVRVTGRKKEILVTTGGKNVAPALLEERIRAHPLVSQCMVVGDGRPFVAALVTLDPDALGPWAAVHGTSGRPADLTDDPDLRAAIQDAVDEANRAVSQAEAVRRFLVLPQDWTEEDGQITPSLKVKRNVVLHQFRREIEQLYVV